jgi:rhodanese-related sulfurtransferase
MFLLLLVSQSLFAQRVMSQQFQNEVNRITKGFGVGVISTTEFREYSKATNFSEHFQILDTRQSYEYKVSHIQGAIHADFDDFDYDDIKSKINKDKTLVLYCSVGYRSGKIAQKLKSKGYNVLNLYGGIFEWSNNRFPLINSKQKETQRVHTYNSDWAKWVETDQKVH